MANVVAAPYYTAGPIPAPVAGLLVHNDRCRKSEYLPKIKKTAILQLIAGSLLVCFGVVAIILLAQWSYFSTPIWSGLLIYVSTGIIGINAASKGSTGLIRAYLGMSIIGSIMGFALTELYIFAVTLEGDSRYGEWEWECQPGGHDSWIPNCAKSEAARITFDSLILVTGFFLFILGIVSSSFGCCASCTCCRYCCATCCGNGGCSDCCLSPSPPTTAVFSPSGAVPSGNGYHQGGPAPNYSGLYVVRQDPAALYQPQPAVQYQQVVVPPGHQVHLLPQGVNPPQQAPPPNYYGATPQATPQVPNPPMHPDPQVDEQKVA